MTQVAIVILNWNGKTDTLECLQSIQKLTVENFELSTIVVDNASTDDSVKEIKNKFKHVEILENKKNLGFAGGNNTGMRYAISKGADFVLVLNNDTIVDKDLVIFFLKGAEKYKNAGIISPKIYFAPGFEFHKDRYTNSEKGHVIWYAGGIIDWDNVIAANREVDDVDVGQHSSEEIDFATGACIFIRREVLEKVGYLDEKYFLYLEDVDFSVRVKKAGWKVILYPEAKLWHKVSQSSEIGGGLNDYYLSRNRLLFGLKYAPLRAKFALLRESINLLLTGREWQKQGIKDFYLGRVGRGSWK